MSYCVRFTAYRRILSWQLGFLSGQNFCMTQIEELCGNPTSEVSHDQIQNIVMFLSRSDSLAKHVDSFIKMLSLLQLKESTPLLLAPVLIGDLSEVDSLRYHFWRSSFLTISTLLINSCLNYCVVQLLPGNSFFFFPCFLILFVIALQAFGSVLWMHSKWLWGYSSGDGERYQHGRYYDGTGLWLYSECFTM